MHSYPELPLVLVSTEVPTSTAQIPAMGTAHPTDSDDATWQLISSLIQLVIVAQRAAKHAGTVEIQPTYQRPSVVPGALVCHVT